MLHQKNVLIMLLVNMIERYSTYLLIRFYTAYNIIPMSNHTQSMTKNVKL